MSRPRGAALASAGASANEATLELLVVTATERIEWAVEARRVRQIAAAVDYAGDRPLELEGALGEWLGRARDDVPAVRDRRIVLLETRRGLLPIGVRGAIVLRMVRARDVLALPDFVVSGARGRALRAVVFEGGVVEGARLGREKKRTAIATEAPAVRMPILVLDPDGLGELGGCDADAPSTSA